MKTFLKILVIAALLIVAIKISPVIFVGAFLGLIAAGVLGAVGVSLLAALAAVLLAFAVALSPIWLPILAIVGIISLFRKAGRAPTPVVTT